MTESCSARLATGTETAVPATFTDLAFADPTHGWVVGRRCRPQTSPGGCAGFIEGTADGGRTWTQEYHGRYVPTSVQAVDATHAVALATTCPYIPPGRTCTSAVLTTASGGTTWTVAHTTRLNLSDVHFATPAEGWAGVRCAGVPNGSSCPGQVLATTDRGRNWTVQLRTAGPVVAVDARGRDVWAVEPAPGPPPAKQASGQVVPGPPIEVLHSSDAGAHWAPAGSVASAYAGYDGALRARARLRFTSPRQGWLSVADQDTCAMHGCGLADLYRTTDGGRSWVVTSPPGTGMGCGPIRIPRFAVLSGGRVLATEEVNLATCSPPATTLSASTDGGSTWGTVHSWDLLFVEALSFPTASQGWALSPGAVLHTTDGGATWAQQLPAPAPVAGISFTGPQDGWGIATASDPGAVLRTADGGRTWQVVARIPGALTELSATGAGRAWVADQALPATTWSVLATTDGGRRWSTVYDLPRHQATIGADGASGLAMFADGGGVLVMTAGLGGWAMASGAPPAVLLTTRDGGRTWGSPRSLPASQDAPLGAVSFASTTTGWAAAGERIETTTDGGLSWSGLGELPGYLPRASLDMVTRWLGWVGVTSSGNGPGGSIWTRVALLRTEGAGTTWARYDLPATMTPTPAPSEVSVLDEPVVVDFLDASHGWLLFHGALWGTADGGATWSRTSRPS
ncbi:MAG: WD40/YVTN/BNR-like repeat-containing protein [Acidimicrobiales bacterium]